jgi:hypothetical protein
VPELGFFEPQSLLFGVLLIVKTINTLLADTTFIALCRFKLRQ